MKKRMIGAAAVFLAAAILASSALAAGAGTEVYWNDIRIADNLTYRDSTYWDPAQGRQLVYTLLLDGPGDAYPIVMEDETVYGTGTISKTISYAESLGMNVLAAVNTDFFSMQTGVPFGLVIENGVYKCSPEGRVAVTFGQDGQVAFSGSAEIAITLQNNGGADDAANAGQATVLTHFNKYRTDTGGMYLFSSDFSTVSTRTQTPGWFVVFEITNGTPSASGTMQLRVVETLRSSGAIPIAKGNLILTAADAGGYEGEFLKFAPGDSVTMTTACNDPNVAAAKWATGGGDILIKDGAITSSSGWDTSVGGQNPRTAFGVKADGTVISFVVDGRAGAASSGLTLTNLAAELFARGCVWAVNFDGGGSSAISVRLPGEASCRVVNNPSDGAERRCATYILYVTDKTSDGVPRSLSLKNSGAVVLAGSSLQLGYTAVDSGYRPAQAPGDVTAASSGLGAVNGATYTAGPGAGVDTITLSSPGAGIGGTGEMFVITSPTSIYAVREDTGASVTSLALAPGESVQLDVSSTFYARSVVSQPKSYTFAVSGGIGTITDTGLITAGTASNVTGTVTISAGGTVLSIPVSIGGFTDTIGNWASDYIDWLVGQGIVNGVTPTTYGPALNIKRADFVLMLYRAAGQPAASPTSRFSDVPPGDYYASAVEWAYQNGITTGIGDGKFAPMSPLTREQAFAFLYRSLDVLGYTVTDGTAADLAGFSDAGRVSQYAVIPAATLVKLGIVSGSDGRLEPYGNLTRDQMAKLLYCVLNDIPKA